MIIRSAQIGDLPVIVDIYNQSIPSKQSTGDTKPVKVDDRQSWFLEHDPEYFPIFVSEVEGKVTGWCSLSPYRPGRLALRSTAEISYYIDGAFHRQGIGMALVRHALTECPRLKIKNVFAIILERNVASVKLLEKMGFQKWGYLPRVADFDGEECGHLYYGMRVWNGRP
ncbi:MAG: N-acetyltransferase family protein [Anaerolineales bacterium]|nr:N-acetyltransferase family protein [Anaerolineales bacterium]